MKTCLVVDDSSVIRKVARRILEDFDFSVDAEQWADKSMFTEDERRFIEFGFSEFFLGEERVTVELLPFALAAPTHEAQIFLTTQISDEAKHTVFWDRFYREVLRIDADSLGDMIDKQRYVVKALSKLTTAVQSIDANSRPVLSAEPLVEEDAVEEEPEDTSTEEEQLTTKE